MSTVDFSLNRNMPGLIAIGVVMLLFGLIIFTYRLNIEDNDKLMLLEREVADLDRKATILKSNQSLAKEQLTAYNQVLAQLIPEKEDYFSIIYALEELSAKTGFTITGYTINLSNSTKEKYSVTVQGNGDANSFLQFLKTYQFAGGRLVTNEKIEFSTDEAGKIKLSLNFYNKKVPTDADTVNPITQTDLALMEQVKKKTTFVIKSGELTTVEEYPVKTNPF